MSLASMSDPASVLQEMVSNVPAGTNPFAFLQSVLAKTLRSGSQSSYRTQLHVLSGLVAAETLLLFATVLVRWARGTFWLFRVHHPSKVILPHYVNTWTLVSAIGLALVQGYIWVSDQFILGTGNDKNYAGWITLVWIPLFLAFWFACWSLCVSHALHLDASGKAPVMSSAWPLNTFGIGIAVAFVACIAITGGLCDKHWREAIDTYRALDAFFARSAAAWQGGPINDAQKLEATSLLGSFVWHYLRFVDNFRRVWIVFFVFGMILEGTFITVATLHLRALRQTLSEIAEHASRKLALQTAQETAVRKTYRALVLVTIGLGIILSCFQALFLFVTIRASEVAGQGKEKEAASLFALYLFMPGLPLAALLLIRALQPPPDMSASTHVAEIELTPHKEDGNGSFGSATTALAQPFATTTATASASQSSSIIKGGGGSSSVASPASYTATPSILSYMQDEASNAPPSLTSTSPSPGPYASYPARSAVSPFDYHSSR